MERQKMTSVKNPLFSNQSLDLFLPEKSTAPAPLVVFIHGGGFFSGDKSDQRSVDVCTLLTGEGFACASVNYSLAARDDKYSTWPGNLRDIAKAIAFLFLHEGEYGYSVARFGLMGCSAGSTLASLYSFGSSRLFEQVELNVEYFTPAALICMYGPFDFRTRPFERRPEDDFLARDLSASHWLELANAGECPPVLGVQGDRDKIVTVDQHEMYRLACERKGVAFESIVVPKFGHAFSPRAVNAEGDTIDLGPQIVSFLDQHLR
jgi:acetyl esterase/lipase